MIDDGDATGTVIIDEQIFQVVNVYLDMEAFLVLARFEGPYQIARGVHSYTIHDRRGGLVARGRAAFGNLHAHEGDIVDITLRCAVRGKTLDEEEW